MLPLLLLFVAGLQGDVEAQVAAYVATLAPPSLEALLEDVGPAPGADELLATSAPAREVAADPVEVPADLTSADATLLARTLASSREALDLARTGVVGRSLAPAWEHLETVRRIATDDAALLVDAHLTLARVLLTRGDEAGATILALEAWRHATPLPPAHDHRTRALYLLYRARYRAHDFEGAERLAAAALVRRLGRAGRDAAACTFLGALVTCSFQRGDVVRALALAEAGVEWRAALPERTVEEAVEVVNLGKMLHSLGRYEDAEARYRRAIALSAEVGGDAWLSALDARSSLALLLQSMGEFEQAGTLAQDAFAELRDRLGPDNERVLAAQVQLAMLRSRVGDHVGGEVLARDVLDRYAASGRTEDWNVAQASIVLASHASARGDDEAALDLARRSLEVLVATVPPGHLEIARAHLDLGEVLVRTGRLDEGIEHLQRALELRCALYDPASGPLAQVRAGLARAYNRAGQHADCVALCREAVAALDDAPAPLERADLASELGRALLALGDDIGAEVEARRAIDLSTGAGGARHPRLLFPYLLLGRALAGQDRLEEAAEAYRAGLDVGAPWRTQLVGGLQDRAFAEGTHATAGRELAQTLARLGRHGEAFDAAEVARGRVLLDLLHEGELEAEVAVDAIAAEEVARRALLSAEERLRATRQRRDLGELRAPRVKALEQAVVAAQRTAREAERRVLTARTAAWPDARPVEHATLRAALQPGEVVLSYTWTWDALVVVAVAADGAPQGDLVQLEDYARELADTWPGLLAPLQGEAAAAQQAARLARLGETLVPPGVRARVLSAHRLVVLPDGPLVDLPFDVLDVGGALVERVDELVVAPSASVYLNRKRAARHVGPSLAVLVGDVDFADAGSGDGDRADGAGPEQASALERLRLFGGRLERLPATADEVARIAHACEETDVEARVLTGASATLTELEGALEGVSHLHIATHGLPGRDTRPFDAALALAPPKELRPDDYGFLTLDHLLRRWGGRLTGCELVVLSACDSSRGARVASTSLSLPWGFFHAGARSVVASRWRVDDQAAALLMARFYGDLLGAHEDERAVGGEVYPPGARMPPARALVEAKRWLRGATRREVRASTRGQAGGPGGELRPYHDPYFWAGFTLVGAPD